MRAPSCWSPTRPHRGSFHLVSTFAWVTIFAVQFAVAGYILRDWHEYGRQLVTRDFLEEDAFQEWIWQVVHRIFSLEEKFLGAGAITIGSELLAATVLWKATRPRRKCQISQPRPACIRRFWGRQRDDSWQMTLLIPVAVALVYLVTYTLMRLTWMAMLRPAYWSDFLLEEDAAGISPLLLMCTVRWALLAYLAVNFAIQMLPATHAPMRHRFAMALAAILVFITRFAEPSLF